MSIATENGFESSIQSDESPSSSMRTPALSAMNSVRSGSPSSTVNIAEVVPNAFAAVSVYLYQSGISAAIAAPMMQNWWLVLGAFMIGGWGASHVAHRIDSKQAQYAALGGFVVLEALIFAPLLYVAAAYAPEVIEGAAVVTLMGSGALIATAMIRP